jgi:hypothetical protein
MRLTKEQIKEIAEMNNYGLDLTFTKTATKKDRAKLTLMASPSYSGEKDIPDAARKRLKQIILNTEQKKDIIPVQWDPKMPLLDGNLGDWMKNHISVDTNFRAED